MVLSLSSHIFYIYMFVYLISQIFRCHTLDTTTKSILTYLFQKYLIFHYNLFLLCSNILLLLTLYTDCPKVHIFSFLTCFSCNKYTSIIWIAFCAINFIFFHLKYLLINIYSCNMCMFLNNSRIYTLLFHILEHRIRNYRACILDKSKVNQNW